MEGDFSSQAANKYVTLYVLFQTEYLIATCELFWLLHGKVTHVRHTDGLLGVPNGLICLCKKSYHNFWYRLHMGSVIPDIKLTLSPPTLNMRVYPKVSGLATWSKNCKWYSSLPLGAVVLLFCESV
jgi:hypothetical protein